MPDKNHVYGQFDKKRMESLFNARKTQKKKVNEKRSSHKHRQINRIFERELERVCTREREKEK